ncbi:hypothetical protein B7P43_G00652, partial [Cryptotermes secundus]
LCVFQLGFFTYYTVAMGGVNPSGPVPIDSVFIYRPDKRLEVWRFLFYMVLHAGWLHLLFNLLVQVLVGLPLEMVHGSLRIGVVYMAGVLADDTSLVISSNNKLQYNRDVNISFDCLNEWFKSNLLTLNFSKTKHVQFAAKSCSNTGVMVNYCSNVIPNSTEVKFLGSLGTSVFDTEVYLVGASGGVYALLAAHLANVLLNYNNMEFGIVRLIGIFVVASADVGFAVYDRYAAEQPGPSVSYVAHLTGALAGLTIGLLVLKNFEQKLHEQLMWWVALGVYAACTIFAVLFNVFNPGYP